MQDSLLNCPIHSQVCDDERRSNIEDLVTESAPRVEDRRVQGTGKGSLSISADGVGYYALLCLRACSGRGLASAFAGSLELLRPASKAISHCAVIVHSLGFAIDGIGMIAGFAAESRVGFRDST